MHDMTARTHPITGRPIEPVGFIRGRAIWPIMGGAPEPGDAGQGDGGAGAGAGTGGQAGNDPAAQAAEAAAAAARAASKTGTEDVASLPDWAQKLITDARSEAGKSRTQAKQNAADEAKAELAQTIGKALGLVKDDKAQVDPAKLIEQATAAQTAARESAVQLAVYRKAGSLTADPEALLDSAAFLASVRDLDPSAADFSTKVESSIKDAVAKNSRLKATQAVGKAGAEFGSVPPNGTTNRIPKPLADAVAGHYGG